MQPTEADPTTDAADALREAPRIPGYRIVRRLGLGGMAMVYLAVQESLDRQVAIKIMRPQRQLDEAQALRFEHEARIIAKLEHPGIVVIHEVGRTLDGELYYVMPYLARGDLSTRHYIDDEPGLISLLRGLLDALDYAHARGIVHRDVKAENVLFDNADRPQLADFGIALARNAGEMRMTGDGLAIGSSAQMSPEQARADVIDGRSDLYSLGVLTYELLTGELPYVASDALALALMHAQDPIPRLPPEKAHWQAFIDRAMAKRPEHRFRNAQAMSRALDKIERYVRRSATPFGRLRNALKPSPLVLVGLAALLTIGAVSVAAPWLRQHGMALPTSEEPAPAVMDESTLQLAREQFAEGRWMEPAGDNAAGSWLGVLQANPDHTEAREGLRTIVERSSDALVTAASAQALTDIRDQYRQIELLADHAALSDAPRFVEARSALQNLAIARSKQAIAALDRDNATFALQFAQELGATDADLAVLHEQLESLPTIGEPVRDSNGPALLAIPAQLGDSNLGLSILMMRDEVSRGDYAAFVAQTQRSASRCRNRFSPLRLFDRRSWSDPGFKQSAREPVVCVSAEDAEAYAAWLSQRTGQRYRLPTRAEWKHASRSTAGNACQRGNIADRNAAVSGKKYDCDDGHRYTSESSRFPANTLGLRDMHGNVAEWTRDCAERNRANRCAARFAIGLSWRDGPDQRGDAQVHEADRGYDDVGFRLVRER